jgi:hypothetical protein
LTHTHSHEKHRNNEQKYKAVEKKIERRINVVLNTCTP